jgi:DNA-binding winged helix-turn-helix (wHTH) protein/tetratricopeptide (TPR) repeat protein
MDNKRKAVYEFGPFRVATAEGILTCNGRAIRLAPKSFDLLVFLVKNRGRVLEKETLLTNVWPGTFVEESNLTKNVSLLRRCLGEREDGTPFIETFPRRGYRFDAEVREAAAAESPQAMQALHGTIREHELGTFVGRKEELRRLEESMEQAARSAGKIVLLSGESGIGKTALAQSFLTLVRRQCPDVLTAQGVCVEQYGPGEAYLPFLEALTSLLASRARERLLTMLRTKAPTWCLHLPVAVPVAERDRMQYETIGATKERMLREMSDFLEALTTETPLLLLFEDLHWADTSSADLLGSLGRRIGTQRLLVVGTYRPEDLEIRKHPLRNYVRELEAHRVGEEIPLQALHGDEIAGYLNARFAPNDFPGKLVALIARKTEGHPLFVSGLAELLIERGDVALHHGRWTLSRQPTELALEVPRSVESIIRNRLERLEENDRRTLECAAIEGEEFTSTTVAAVLELEEIAVEEHLDHLDKVHRLVRRLGEEELPDGSLAIRYRFAHALYQNALYGNLVPGRRAFLHRRAGTEVLRRHAGRECRVAAQLATHFERGRDFPRAIEYLLEMGDNACRLYDNMAALEHYSRALELTDKLPEAERAGRRLRAYQKRGTAQLALGRLQEAEEAFRRALDQSRAMEDAQAECVALNALAKSLIPSHKLTDLATAATEAMTLAERIGSQPLQAEAMTNLGLVAMASGDAPQSRKLLEQTIPFVRACHHTPALLPALTFGGLLHNFRSEYQQAEALEVEASALASEARDGFHLPLSLFYLGIIQGNRGRFSEALATLSQGLEVARRNGNRIVLSRIPNAMGFIYRELREVTKAIQYDSMSAQIAKEMKLAEAEAHALINLTHDYVLAGETGLAKASLLEAAPLLERDPWYRWRFLDIRMEAAAAEVWLAENQLDRAHAHATRLLVNSAQHGAPKYKAISRNLLAEIAMVSGDYERATAELRNGLAEIRQHPAPLAAWKSWGILGRALAHAGDREGAQEAYAESAVILETIAHHTEDRTLRSVFLSAPDVRAVFGGVAQRRAATKLVSKLQRRSVAVPRSPSG